MAKLIDINGKVKYIDGAFLTLVLTFFNYFLFTYCGFSFLLYVYTTATMRYQTNTTRL